MTRTKLCDRVLPAYTKGEEYFNTISHIIGAAFGVAALIMCLLVSSAKQDPIAVISSIIYGLSLILLYTMSSVYHGLKNSTAKKVMQVIDHCTIYLLIGGSYTPPMLCAVLPHSPLWAWAVLGIVWGCAVIAIILTAIDLKKYAVFSMSCYLGMGWCAILAIKPIMEAVPLQGLLWLVAGGISYTFGAVLYGFGKKYRYMHSLFHLFVLAGSIMHFIAIFQYILL